ncbi:NINE protein [Parahaliea maris]|uniref:NINE protein n=1 Tax=Parahaliea maris TaxID=2716870 RepID=A0A5C8ZWX9_9GAMM|nr:pilin [Parahaliea maris]TXS93015.1 NINE protein [Parahaliea maris]
MTMKNCQSCGGQLEQTLDQCPSCGAIQESFAYTSKTAAAVLAFFGGNFGLHRFYLGQWWGVLYLLLFWTYIPALVGIIEAIVFSLRDQQTWNAQYNKGISFGREKGGLILIIVLTVGMIFILGILAAIALPAYQDYTIRAKMTEPMLDAAELKMIVAEHVLVEGAWPQSLASTGSDFRPQSSLVQSATIEDGVIHIQVAPATGTQGELIFVPSYEEGEVTWSCEESTVPARYLPAACR